MAGGRPASAMIGQTGSAPRGPPRPSAAAQDRPFARPSRTPGLSYQHDAAHVARPSRGQCARGRSHFAHRVSRAAGQSRGSAPATPGHSRASQGRRLVAIVRARSAETPREFGVIAGFLSASAGRPRPARGSSDLPGPLQDAADKWTLPSPVPRRLLLRRLSGGGAGRRQPAAPPQAVYCVGARARPFSRYGRRNASARAQQCDRSDPRVTAGPRPSAAADSAAAAASGRGGARCSSPPASAMRPTRSSHRSD